MSTELNDTLARLRTLTSNLLYPAFLGTFLFSLFEHGWSADGPPWPWLFVLYFALQYMEGSIDPNQTGWQWAVDWLEIAAMVALFFAFGYFAGDVKEQVAKTATSYDTLSFSCINWLAGVVFILPVINRVIMWLNNRISGQAEGKYVGFYWALTGLSTVAAIFVLFSLSWCSFVIVTLVFLIYAVGFLFFNFKLFSETSSFRRPPLGGQHRQ